ncbi:MAG: phytoene desaturase family protein [Candidatus Hodarchaeales archaeon]|jgi:phytoene desaturase (3,4-didehydrolycopene-forming)
MKHIIIIGAGVGGISAASRLGKSGFQVTVVEKNSTPGGRCNHIEKDGHSFDSGPTILLMKEIFSEAFADLNEKIEDHLELIRVDPSHSIFFKDGSKLSLTSNPLKMKKTDGGV